MIAFLTGRVAGKAASYCLLDVAGVGYKLNMTTGSLASLPSEGDEVTVFTYLYVREDELTLFGFENEDERFAFEQLLAVSGVGPKVALATLSALSAEVLATAVAAQDIALISSVPGVGKKTAQRMCLDLADKLGAGDLGPGARQPGTGAGAVMAETTDALLSMGFSSAEAATALKGYEGPADDVQSLLTYALKRLGSSR